MFDDETIDQESEEIEWHIEKVGRYYKWRPGSSFKVDAQVAGEYLEELREQNDGVLTKTDVYQAAQDPDSPIHGEFQWDVQKAAEAHWRARAGDMIRHLAIVRVKQMPASDGVPAFLNVRLTTTEGTKRGYVTGTEVLSSADLHEQVVAQALKQLKGLEGRYGKLVELDGVWEAIRKAEKRRANKKK